MANKFAFNPLSGNFDLVTEAQDLQDVTDVGSTTTNNITANSFIKSGGTSAQFLKADGTVDTGIDESEITLSDTTTNNTTTLKHGFAPKLSGTSTQFLNGEGNWVTPAGTANAYIEQSFSATTSVVVTHNFGAYPIVQVIVGGDVYIPYTITHNTINAFTVTFSASTSGSVVATLGSPQLNNYVTVAGNYTILDDDYLVIATGAGSVITLPSATGLESKTFIIKNTSLSNITIDTGTETIDGENSIILASYESVSLVCDGNNYFIV